MCNKCLLYTSGNLGTLEDGYGINLLPLATFAMDTYADDPVSYTHLDVYKRQVYSRLIRQRLSRTSLCVKEGHSLLDVYKRQDMD